MTPTILHVTQPTTAGVAKGVLALATDQTERGWPVVVASPGDGDLGAWLDAAGVRRARWEARRSPGPSLAAEVRRLERLVRELEPDVVHLHSSKAGAAGRLAVRGARPTVFQPHAWSFAAVRGTTAAVATRWERFAVRWTDLLVCVSDGERRQGESAGVHATWLTAPNGVDLEDYAVPEDGVTQSLRARHDLGAAPVVVCVGRLCLQKGQDVLLDAWSTVRLRVPDARLLMVGDGPDRDRLRARGASGVTWVGEVADVREWLTLADVVALPSRWEGLAYSMVEAMAMGRSVVTTAVSGSEDLAGAGAGAVVPIEDPTALAAALVARLADPGRARREGRAGRLLAEHRYDRRRQLDTVATATSRLLRQPSHGD